MGKKKDKEFGSQANLVKNAEKTATNASDRRKNLSRTQSRVSEFETVSYTYTFNLVCMLLNSFSIRP